MISLIEVAERARSGQRIDDKTWGLGLFKKLEVLIGTYNLKQKGPETFYNVDDEYADALFQAAVDLLVDMGVYCTTTHRVIQFSEDEVQGAVREVPPQVTIGAGRDQRVWTKRDIEDQHPPAIAIAGHGPWSDQLISLPLIVRELVRHPRVDLIEGYMYARIDGREVNGAPLRAYAARRAIEKVRQGLTMAGRRGLAITYYPVLTDAFSMVAPLDTEQGLRNSDGAFFTILPDLKVEEDLIAAAVIYNEWGCYGQSGGWGVGPFGGSLEGRMIEATAGPLASWLVYRDTILDVGRSSPLNLLPGKADPVHTESRARETDAKEHQWRSFAIQQALRRNTNQIYYKQLWGGNRISYDMTSEQYLLQVALSSIEATILGLNFRIGVTNPPTYTSWIVETSDAAIKSHLTLEAFVTLSMTVQQDKLTGYPPRPIVQDQRMYVYGDNPHVFLAAGLKAYDWYMQRPTNAYLDSERKARHYLRDQGLSI
jgi:methylamine--corrinoid protein Co-methyltransferase